MERPITAVRPNAYGDDWWRIPLKATGGPALVNEHAGIHADIERLIIGGVNASSSSALVQWKEAQQRAARLLAGTTGFVDESEAAQVIAEGIASKYQEDPEDGSPLGLSPKDALTIKALTVPDAAAPAKTLLDAKAFYLKDRLAGGVSNEHKAAAIRLERVFGRLAKALGPRFHLPLSELAWADGRTFRGHLLSMPKLGAGERLYPERQLFEKLV